MEDECFFHGTSITNAKKIITKKNVITHIKKIKKIKINEGKNKIYVKTKGLGTLGYGFYSFVQIQRNAVTFAKKIKSSEKRGFDENIGILKFRIKDKYKENVLNLSDPETLAYKEKFIIENTDDINELEERYNNDTLAHKLDGAIIETFIDSLNNNDNQITSNEIMAVRGISTNNFGHIVKKTSQGNSVEMSIRNNLIIDYDTMKLEEIGDDIYEI